jgi:hypothetical protein
MDSSRYSTKYFSVQVVLNEIQNYYAAHGSSASIEDIINFASANVEILRDVTRDMTDWLGVNDPHRNKTEVDSRADILALCSSLKTSNVHVLTANRLVQAPETKRRKAAKDPKVAKERQSAVKDVIVTPWTVCRRGGSTPSGWNGSGRVGDVSDIGET